MRRRNDTTAQWPAIHVEGGIINSAMLARIAASEASEQKPQDYGLRKGLRLNDEISIAFRVGRALFEEFDATTRSFPHTLKFVRELLQDVFGFDDLQDAELPLALAAGEGRVPVVVVPPPEAGERSTRPALDRRHELLSAERAHSPAGALQDYLNEHEEALWGLACNGEMLRLMRDNHSLTRPAWIEADLRQIFVNEDYASFSLLWLLIHRSRFGPAGVPAPDCALERWREEGFREGTEARDRLASQVEKALKVLGTGFLQANPHIASDLQEGRLRLLDFYNELLHLVYRLIFLMVAEDRDLLHPRKSRQEARDLYARGYSLALLRRLCTRRATWDHHHDRYEGLKIVFQALAHGEELLALPPLGGLFAPDQMPRLARQETRLPNRALMQAIWHLAWLSDKDGTLPVNWRAMATEELGSVYESLLELQPRLAEGGRAFTFATEGTEKKGHQRKTTGSYYTPDSLVQALLDTALDPVLDEVEAVENPERALLQLKIIDPACGSGHFLLAAARRMAGRLARLRAQAQPSAEDFRQALRDVTRHCIHGVDRNPMAVELTRVALWIETVDPGRPLGFFDAQIRCGDSLLGVFDLDVLEQGIPDTAFKALTGDDKTIAKHYRDKNKRERKELEHLNTGLAFGRQGDLVKAFRQLRNMPEETLGDIERKRQRLEQLRAQGSHWWRLEQACDMYVAAWLQPKRKDFEQFIDIRAGAPQRNKEMVPTTGALWRWLRGETVYGPMFGAAIDAARDARAFHWPLEFPDVMARGGFDVVLGNPPWERIKLQEKEFFAARDPEIANAPNKAARDKLIRERAAAAPGTPQRQLHDDFIAAKRFSEAISEFVRTPASDGGRFPFTGTGDVNTYALFAELFARLSRQRAGIIVPTGIATDATTAPFFAHLVENRRLASLFDFENRERLFPAVDSRMKFCLLTLAQNVPQARFAFFLTNVAQLAEEERLFTLTPEQIAAINPNTRTAPVFRSRKDAELTAKIYARVPVLIDETKGKDGNPWGVHFARLFDMSNDSHLFRTAGQLADAGFERQGTDWVKGAERHVPLYEAKMIHQFDHRWTTYEKNSKGKLATRDVRLEEKADPAFEPSPRYWVPEAEVRARLAEKGWKHQWLMGWRDIARATDERTLISGIIPPVACGDKFLIMMPSQIVIMSMGLFANMNCLVTDFIARQKLGGTSFKYFTMKQICLFSPNFYTQPRLDFIVPRVLELTYTSWSLKPFAEELGYDGPPFAWDEDRRALLRAELDAFYARAYELNRDELRYILDPADVMGPDYPSETFRVLKTNEIKKYGECRTRRLILEAWDRFETDGTFRKLDLPGEEIPITAPPPIVIPPFAELPDGAWAWPSGISRADRIRYAAHYALWIADPSRDAPNMRWIVACLVEPALLTPWLNEPERSEWIRLMGDDARPREGVARLYPRIDEAWRDAFQRLISSGQLQEDENGNWIRGNYFRDDILSPTSERAQRAAFVIQAVRRLDMEEIRDAVPQEFFTMRVGNGAA